MPGENDVIERLGRVRVLPVATVDDPERAEPLGRALVGAGLPCVEIALRSAAAADAIAAARRIEGLLVGAGTVLSAADADRAAAAGAQFAVAPGFDPDVLERCREHGLPFFPGVATPTEIQQARAFGARTLKVFPAAQLGGVAFLRAVSATFPDVSFIPTGGVGPDDVAHYLAVPSVLACGGTWLAHPALVRDGAFDEIERIAREALELGGARV